jgi:predicted dehydrogenase
LRRLIAEGAVGELQTIRASFGLAFSDPSNIRLNPALGGGDGFRFEAEQFASLVRCDSARWHGATPQESIDIARVLDGIRASSHDDGRWVNV